MTLLYPHLTACITLAVSGGVGVANGVVGYIGIQVQAVAPVGVFLGETADDRVVISCTQVVLACDAVILLACVGNAVWYGFFVFKEHSKGVIPVTVAYVLFCVGYMYSAALGFAFRVPQCLWCCRCT